MIIIGTSKSARWNQAQKILAIQDENIRDRLILNKAKANLHKMQWARNNREKSRAINKRYRQTHKKECSIRNTKWASSHRDKVRGYRFKRLYGITIVDYEKLLEQQHGLCAIHGGISLKLLAVDHSHKTNKVRGLLCDQCNVGLGSFGDDASLLRKAADYLDKHSVQQVPDNVVEFPKTVAK